MRTNKKKPQLVVSIPFITVICCVFGMIMLLLSGCKKEEAPPGSQSAISSSAESDLNALKADIVVHSGGSIQAAVDAAKPGNVIKIEPGIYKEAITVNKAGLKIIGIIKNDNGVIIENPGDEEDGISVGDASDGFVLANVTVKGFKDNGVLLDSVDGFCLTKVAAMENGEYGIFPVHCTNGSISHCFASGHSDTGIYVGQSSDIKMEFNEAVANVNGLEVENSSDVWVRYNNSHNNVCGMLIDLLPGKDIKTSSNVHINQNHVYNNNHKNFGAPGELESYVPVGIGILVLGTDNTSVENNLVTGNNFLGIVTFSTLVLGQLAGIPPDAFKDIEPNPDGARITKNVLKNNGSNPPVLPIPLPGVDLLWDGSGVGNCWSNNVFTSSYPSPLPSCN